MVADVAFRVQPTQIAVDRAGIHVDAARCQAPLALLNHPRTRHPTTPAEQEHPRDVAAAEIQAVREELV